MQGWNALELLTRWPRAPPATHLNQVGAEVIADKLDPFAYSLCGVWCVFSSTCLVSPTILPAVCNRFECLKGDFPFRSLVLPGHHPPNETANHADNVCPARAFGMPDHAGNYSFMSAIALMEAALASSTYGYTEP